MTDDERDDARAQIRCQCGCTLDVYICRTTDFSCQVSPAMHRDVIALVEGGYSAQEILDAFVETYGERRADGAQAEGFNWAGYLVPFAALGGGRRGARDRAAAHAAARGARWLPRRRRCGAGLAARHARTSWRASRRRSAATTDARARGRDAARRAARSRTCSIRSCSRRRRRASRATPSRARPHRRAATRTPSSRCARSSSTARRASCPTRTTPSSRRATPQRALDAMRAERVAPTPAARRGRGRSGGARLSRAPAELRALRTATGAGRDLLLELRRVPRRASARGAARASSEPARRSARLRAAAGSVGYFSSNARRAIERPPSSYGPIAGESPVRRT